MNKCSIDDKSLKLIQSRVATIFREHLKNESTLEELKKKIKNELDKIADKYELTDIDSIINIILKVSIRYGLAAKNPDFFNSLNLSNLLIAKREGILINNSSETSTDNLTDTEQVKLRYDASREFLDNAYGLAKEVSTYVLNTTNRNIFDCLFVNRGSLNLPLGIVQNNTDLNRNIREYLEALLLKITTYLRLVVKDAPNLHTSKEVKALLEHPKLYREVDGVITNTGILEQIYYLSNMYLSSTNFNVDNLRLLYNDINNSTLSLEERNSAKLKLEAYNAKVILDHFDTYLSITLGKIIQIKDFNLKTGEDKYLIAESTANLATTWRVSENIFVEDEADMVTKLAINTTPLIKWQQSTPYENRFINFLDFEHIIAKIKDIVYKEDAVNIVFNSEFIEDNKKLWRSLSEDTRALLKDRRLSTVISMIRRNPRQYIHSIFELLTNNQFYDLYAGTIYKDFTKDELDKLYSISRGIFNGENSIYELTRQYADNDYYSYITQTVDAIYSVSYLLYYKDLDGIISVRTFIDLSINNIRRNIELTINTSNSGKLIKDFNQHKAYLNIVPDSTDKFKSLTYIIPNTNIRVHVVASSGSVTFYDNTTNLKITNFMELWNNDDIKAFIDDILHLNIANDVNLQEELHDIEKSWSVLCTNLLEFSSRVILSQYISNEFLKGKSMDDKEVIINSLFGRNAPKYNYTLDELGMIHGNDVGFLKRLAIAKANLYGLTTSSLTKDGAGNGQSMYTLSRLLGSLLSLFELLEKQPWSASKDFILLNIPGVYEGVYTAKEFYNEGGDNKESTDMNVSELSYAGIVQDFVKGFINSTEDRDLVGNGHILLLPSVNSDKGTIGRIRININKTIEINGLLKAIKDLNKVELEQLIALEFGNFYTNMYNAIVSDWDILDNYLKSEGILLPVLLSKDFINGFELFNTFFEKNKKLFIKYGNTPVELIKYFVLKYNNSHRLHPLELIDLVHYKSNKGKLGINESIIALIARFNPSFISNINPNLLLKYPSAVDFWTNKKAEIVKTLLKSNFVINTTNLNLPELKFIRDNIPNWINSSGNVILAKVNVDGKLINITSTRDLIKFGISDISKFIDSYAYKLELNPIIELYNYLDYLFTLEFMNSTVGSFVAHPAKGKINDVLELEAAQFLALHKRNVSFTASMHPFLLNLLNGIPEYYNIAVIEDIKDYLGTITGTINEIKPFDGATFVNPFVVILENNSLGGAKAGITKKLFVHFKNERTGTGGIIKTAGFGLTNDWIRNSPFLERMMQKMTDHIWLELDGSEAEVDITTNFRKNPIKYKDFFFKQNGKYYKILDIKKAELPNTYERYIQEVNLDGSIASNPDGSPAPIIKEGPVTINTNYKLWNFFGGKNSMKMDGRFLKLSNTSVENVVIAMNNIGTEIGHPSKIETLDLLWLPLKLVDVHYVATAGAVKLGAANINSASKYSNNLGYDTQRIKMYQAGILLDKEHHADNSELSLMTLVISACAAKGYTFQAATKLYDALRKATEVGTKDHLQAIKNYFTNGTLQAYLDFQEVLMKSIINSLSAKQNLNGNFALIIASDIIKLAKEGKEIKFSEVALPLSDNTVYAKLAATIASYLTKTGIKLKIPGILSVLTTSHEIFKLYAGRKYESFDNPELELKELLDLQVPVFDALYLFSPDMLEFAGMRIVYVPENSLISPTDNLPVAARNPHDGTILIDDVLLRLRFEEKAWRNTRNSKPLNRDFRSYEDWKKFVLLHEAMHNIYPRLEGESSFDYETRINELALKRFDNDISNLELGREYFITKEFMEEVEDDLGNIVQMPVPYTESKLIRTPAEYYLLKLDIANGVVTSVVENILVGRNLAGYNVRYTADTGERFQLWDLDSASVLFSLNELKENWSNSLEDLLKLQELYTKLFNVAPNLDIFNALNYIFLLELRTRRMLLNDLENLSKSSLDTKKQYEKLLSTREDTPAWYLRYTNWINVKLGRGHGNRLYLGNQFIQVTSKNFEEVQSRVAKILDTTTKVRINGKYYTIDKSTVTTLAYELIMPKIFATVFGLKEFDDLLTIANDKDFFVKQYLENLSTKVNTNLYTVELKVSNGNHFYLLNKNQLGDSGLTRVIPLVVTLEGRTYRLDSNSNIMYEITPDTEFYLDSLGNLVIVTNDLGFYINNLSYDSIKLSENLTNYPELVRLLSKVLKTSSNKNAKSFYKYITSYGNMPKDIMKMNSMYHSLTLDNYKLADPAMPIIKLGREKHVSFLQSLDVVAARIPALSMQSYMPMRVVAFDNPDINTAYVSTYLILLLGSKN